MASAVTLIAALIGCMGSVVAAVITTRQRGPAGVPAPADLGPGHSPYQAVAAAPARTSRSVYWAWASCVTWIIPAVAVFTLAPGFWIAVRDMRGPRKGTTLAVALLCIALVATMANSAWGAYQQAHGQLWFQHS